MKKITKKGGKGKKMALLMFYLATMRHQLSMVILTKRMFLS